MLLRKCGAASLWLTIPPIMKPFASMTVTRHLEMQTWSRIIIYVSTYTISTNRIYRHFEINVFISYKGNPDFIEKREKIIRNRTESQRISFLIGVTRKTYMLLVLQYKTLPTFVAQCCPRVRTIPVEVSEALNTARRRHSRRDWASPRVFWSLLFRPFSTRSWSRAK